MRGDNQRGRSRLGDLKRLSLALSLFVFSPSALFGLEDCADTEQGAVVSVVDEACRVVACEDGKFVTVESEEQLDQLLGAYEGEPVFFHIFATWCGVCKHEFKEELGKLHDMYRDKGVRFIAVAVDQRNEERLQKYVDDLEIGMTVWRDPGMTTARKFGAFGVPHSVFIDASGERVYARMGPITHTDSAVLDAFNRIADSKTN